MARILLSSCQSIVAGTAFEPMLIVDGVERAFAHVFAQPGVSSMIVGTINPDHLRGNVEMLEHVLQGGG